MEQNQENTQNQQLGWAAHNRVAAGKPPVGRLSPTQQKKQF